MSAEAAEPSEGRSPGEALATSARLVCAPVTAILTQVELLRDGALGELPHAGQGALDVIAANARAIVRIQERLAFLARLATDDNAEDAFPIDPAELVQAVILATRATVEAGRQVIEVAVAPELPPVQCFSRRIHEALVELIDNAARFSSEGGNLRLRVALDDLPDAVRFTVSDSGAGIASSVVDSTLRRADGAAGWQSLEIGGLGLAVVAAVVRASGGRLGIESTLGVGTSVWFTVPATAARDARARE